MRNISTLPVRDIGGLSHLVLGVIVLGLSTHINDIVRQASRLPPPPRADPQGESKGIPSQRTTFTFNIITAAWAIITEILLFAARHRLSHSSVASFAVEITILLVSTVFWLGKPQDTADVALIALSLGRSVVPDSIVLQIRPFPWVDRQSDIP